MVARLARGLPALLAAGLLIACAAPSPPAPPVVVPDAPPALSPPAPGRDCARLDHIAIFKERRLLVGRCEGGAEVSFAVAFGRGLQGAKREAGDQRTPEGLYHVSGAPRPSRFHRFVPIDYPSREDAEAALADGRIGLADHARILAAHDRGEMPPHDTLLGGGLGLHGEGEDWRGFSADLDWTFGCIAMSDPDIDFLVPRAPPGTPVEIAP